MATFEEIVRMPPVSVPGRKIAPFAAPEGPDERSVFGDLSRSLQIGVTQAVPMSGNYLKGVGGGFLRTLGADDLAAQWERDAYQANIGYGVRIQELEDKIDSPTTWDEMQKRGTAGGVVMYALNTLFKQAPILGSQFAVAALTTAITKNPAAGIRSFVGMSTLFNSAEIYSSALAATGESNPFITSVAGFGAGLIDVMPWARVINKWGRGSDYGAYIAKNIKMPKYQRRLLGSLEIGALEGTTEGFQNIIEQITVDYLRDRKISWDRMVNDPEFKESIAQGGMIGVMLGPIGAASRIGYQEPPFVVPPEVTNIPPDPTTEDAVSALGIPGIDIELPTLEGTTEIVHVESLRSDGRENVRKRKAGPLRTETDEEGNIKEYVEYTNPAGETVRIDVKLNGEILQGVKSIETFAPPSFSPAADEMLQRFAIYATTSKDSVSAQAAAALSDAKPERRQYAPASVSKVVVNRRAGEAAAVRSTSSEQMKSDANFWKARQKIANLEDEFWVSRQERLKDGAKKAGFAPEVGGRGLERMQRDLDMAELEMAIAGLEAARLSESEGGVAESPDGRSIAQLERFIESPPDYIRTQRVRRLGFFARKRDLDVARRTAAAGFGVRETEIRARQTRKAAAKEKEYEEFFEKEEERYIEEKKESLLKALDGFVPFTAKGKPRPGAAKELNKIIYDLFPTPSDFNLGRAKFEVRWNAVKSFVGAGRLEAIEEAIKAEVDVKKEKEVYKRWSSLTQAIAVRRAILKGKVLSETERIVRKEEADAALVRAFLMNEDGTWKRIKGPGFFDEGELTAKDFVAKRHRPKDMRWVEEGFVADIAKELDVEVGGIGQPMEEEAPRNPQEILNELHDIYMKRPLTMEEKLALEKERRLSEALTVDAVEYQERIDKEIGLLEQARHAEDQQGDYSVAMHKLAERSFDLQIITTASAYGGKPFQPSTAAEVKILSGLVDQSQDRIDEIDDSIKKVRGQKIGSQMDVLLQQVRKLRMRINQLRLEDYKKFEGIPLGEAYEEYLRLVQGKERLLTLPEQEAQYDLEYLLGNSAFTPTVFSDGKWAFSQGVRGKFRNSFFLFDWLMNKGTKEVTEISRPPLDATQIWYPKMEKEATQDALTAEAKRIMRLANGEVKVDKGGTAMAMSGIKGANYRIQQENRGKAVKQPLLPLLDVTLRSEEKIPLYGDRTSRQIFDEIMQYLEASVSEPAEITKIKDDIQDRLAKRDGVSEGKELSTKKKLTADEKATVQAWKKLRPATALTKGAPVRNSGGASLDGRYILAYHKVTIRVEGEGKPVKKTTDLLVAFNPKDEITGIQDFDRVRAENALADLDILRAQYKIVQGSKDKTWEKVPTESIANIFIDHQIPLRGIYVKKEMPTPEGDRIVDFTRAGVRYGVGQDDSGEIILPDDEVRKMRAVFLDRPSDVMHGTSTTPVLQAVFTGTKADIPKNMKRGGKADGEPLYMKKDEETGYFVEKEITIARTGGIRGGVQPKVVGREQAFERAYAELSPEDQLKFRSLWKRISPPIRISLRTADGVKEITGRIVDYIPAAFNVQSKPVSLRTVGDPVQQDLFPEGQVPYVVYKTNKYTIKEGRGLGKPRQVTERVELAHLLVGDVRLPYNLGAKTQVLGQTKISDTVDILFNKTSEEMYILEDTEGNKHPFTKADILSGDNAAFQTVFPDAQEMTNAQMVDNLQANLIHEREPNYVFASRMSMPEIGYTTAYRLERIPDQETGYIEVETDPVATIIPPTRLTVGAKVKIMESAPDPRLLKVTMGNLHKNRDLLRDRDNPNAGMKSYSQGTVARLYKQGRLQIKSTPRTANFGIRYGKWVNISPAPQQLSAENYTVARIVGEKYYLDGVTRPYSKDQIELVGEVPFDPLVKSIIEIETTDEGGNVITIPTEIVETINARWNRKADELLRLGMAERTLPWILKDAEGARVRPTDVKAGDAVMIDSSVFAKGVRQKTGQVTYEILKTDEGVSLINVMEPNFLVSPNNAYTVGKKVGNSVWLLDPATGRTVIGMPLKSLSRNSINSIRSKEAIAESRPKVEKVSPTVEGRKLIPWDFQEVGVSPAPYVEPTSYYEEVIKGVPVRGKARPLTEKDIEYYHERGEFTTIEGKPLEVGMMRRLTELDEFGNIIWETEPEYQKIDVAGYSRPLQVPAGFKDAPKGGMFRAAPLRQWKNAYDVTISEYILPEMGVYYEVYSPQTSDRFKVAERFWDEDAEVALKKATDKYGSSKYYDDLTPAPYYARMGRAKATFEGRVYHEEIEDWNAVHAQGGQERLNAKFLVDWPSGVETWEGSAEMLDGMEETTFEADRHATKDTVQSLNFSIVQNTSYTEGILPQKLVRKGPRQGTSVEEIAKVIYEGFGPGIFNFTTLVNKQVELPVGINTSTADIQGVAYNNEVWLVAENIPKHMIIPVIFHEIGAHGIRAIIGTKAYESLLAQVARLVSVDANMRQAYNAAKGALLKTYPDANEKLILEETLGYYAEANAPTNNTFWRMLFDYILAGLHRLKLILDKRHISGWQVMVMIRSSLQAHTEMQYGKNGKMATYVANYLNMPLYQTGSGEEWAFHVQSDEIMREALGEMSTQDWLSGPNGYFPEAKGFFGRMFKLNWGPEELKKPARYMPKALSKVLPGGVKELTFPAWVLGKKAGVEKARFWITPGYPWFRAIVDSKYAQQMLEEGLEQREGVISESPRRALKGFQNVSADKIGAFESAMIDPMMKWAKENEVNTTDLFLYTYAKVAPFYNIEFAKKSKSKSPASGIWSEIKQDIEASEDGSQIGRIGSAEEILAELEESIGADGMERLRYAAENFVYPINDFRLQVLLDAGILSKNEYNRWMGQPYIARPTKKNPEGRQIGPNPNRQELAKYYVPLRGENLSYVDDILSETMPKGRRFPGFGVKGPVVRRATGRRSPAENTWAWSAYQAQTAIKKAEKNRIVQTFARLIYENKELMKDQAVIIHDDDFGGSGRDEEGDLHLGLLPKNQMDKQHVISFWQGGEQWHIIVKDRRIGRAWNETHVKELGGFMQVLQMTTRYFAMMSTSFSPEFMITNPSRDYQLALANLLGHEVETRKGLKGADRAKMALEVTKYGPKAIKDIFQYTRNGKTDTPGTQLVQEFSAAGGRIEFYGFKSARAVERKVNNYVSMGTAGGLKRGGSWFLEYVSDMNSALENMWRLGSYKVVKEYMIANGVPESEAIQEAADLSRNLTVNFTQRGELTPIFNAVYLFFNAATAGSVRTLMSYNRSQMFRKFMHRYFLAALPVVWVAYMLGGEDDDGRNRYAQIPMSQRHRQMHLPVPGADAFAKIPLGYGINIPFVLADTVMALGFKQINFMEAAWHMMGATIESFVPISWQNSDRFSVSIAKNISPTITDPIIDIMANENWTGNPIYKVPFPGSYAEPPAYRSWSTTTAPSKFIAEWLNRLTGGSKYESGVLSFHPTVIDYMYDFYLGSAGRFIKKGGTIPIDFIVNGKIIPRHEITGDIAWNAIPLARRFISDPSLSSKWDVNDKYNAYRGEIENAQFFMEGIYKDFGPTSKQWKGFKKSDHYDIARLDAYKKKIVGEVTKLYKIRAKIRGNRLISDDTKRLRLIDIDRRIQKLKTIFVKSFEDALDRGVRIPFKKAA